MIIEYEDRYMEDVKDLLLSLGRHIEKLDKEGFNITSENYREEYFLKIIKSLDGGGKILLYEDNGTIVGMVAGVILEAEDTFDFRSPKRGRITELVVLSAERNKGYGSALLSAMEEYFRSQGCKNILIAALAYNVRAEKLYESHGYHPRLVDLTKSI